MCLNLVLAYVNHRCLLLTHDVAYSRVIFVLSFHTILTSGNKTKSERNQLKIVRKRNVLCSPLCLRIESGTIGENLKTGPRVWDEQDGKSENIP